VVSSSTTRTLATITKSRNPHYRRGSSSADVP